MTCSLPRQIAKMPLYKTPDIYLLKRTRFLMVATSGASTTFMLCFPSLPAAPYKKVWQTLITLQVLPGVSSGLIVEACGIDF